MTAPAATARTPAPPLQAALTPEQAAAATADARLVVIEAGAGTGKTHTLAARAAWLVHQGVPGPRIVALTFTRDATANLKRRIGLRLGTRDHAVRVLSFHQFAARELRPGAGAFLEDADARRLMATAARPVLASPRGRILGRVLGGDTDDDATQRLLGLVSYVKNRETSVGGALDEQFPNLVPFRQEIELVIDRYLEATNGCMDFDDLLLAFRDRLADPKFRAHVVAHVDHLLVDEYQDVNGVQHDIVRRIAEGPDAPAVTLVGDDRQAIYGFRASEPGNLVEAAERDTAERIALTRNFRSGGAILEAANRLLPSGDRDLRPADGAPAAAEPEVHAFVAEDEEARYVADRVERLLAQGTDPAEIAVLSRSRHLAVPYQQEVTARVGRGRRLARTPTALGEATEWVHAWLTFTDPAYALTADTRDVVGRLLAPLVPRASDVLKFVDDALELKAAKARGERATKRPGSSEAWRAFTSLRDARDRLQSTFEDDAYPLHRVVGEIGALPWQDRTARDAVAHLAHLLRLRDEPTDADAARKALREAAASVGETQLPEVPVLTIHAAKGLEWDHVFLVGAREGGLPSEQSSQNERLLEEERRLMYVACTRPRHSLVVTHATREGRRRRDASRFLDAWNDESPADDAQED